MIIMFFAIIYFLYHMLNNRTLNEELCFQILMAVMIEIMLFDTGVYTLIKQFGVCK